VKSLQQLAADTASPQVGVDKDHGHVAIAGDDRSSAVLRATGLSQCHCHYVPVRAEVADDQARIRLCQLLPDPGYPGSAGGQESGDVCGVPEMDGSFVICREPIENTHRPDLTPPTVAIPPGVTLDQAAAWPSTTISTGGVVSAGAPVIVGDPPTEIPQPLTGTPPPASDLIQAPPAP